MKVTAILCMNALEPSIEFWTNRFGFQLTVSVPHGGTIGFAILQKGNAELMLQSHASSAEDLTSLADHCRDSKSVLFVEVDDFDDLLPRLAGLPVALEERTTFYGMREIGIFDPGGHLVIFAAPTQR